MKDIGNNTEEVRERYLGLPDNKKQLFLAILSNKLTIYARSFIEETSGEFLIQVLTGLNELQHQISQHIAALCLERERYPDDVLWTILQEKAVLFGLSATLERSLEFALSRSIQE